MKSEETLALFILVGAFSLIHSTYWVAVGLLEVIRWIRMKLHLLSDPPQHRMVVQLSGQNFVIFCQRQSCPNVFTTYTEQEALYYQNNADCVWKPQPPVG